MIQITKQSRDLTKVEKYLMTVSPAVKSMKEVEDDTPITVDAIVDFNDVNEDTGEYNEICAILTPDKEVYAFQSKTFRNSLADIESIMEGDPFTIIKISGTTNAGRGYINCILDVSSL